VGGGRYDNLVKVLGGEAIPGIGGAAGIERIVELMKAKASKFYQSSPEIFLGQIGSLAKRKGLKLFEEFRKAKILVAESFGRDSLKAQLRVADKIEAKYTLLLGQKEALEGTIIVRDMKTGRQDVIRMDKVVGYMKRKLKSRS
jgi:histidyl-tRNA synthetase